MREMNGKGEKTIKKFADKHVENPLRDVIAGSCDSSTNPGGRPGKSEGCVGGDDGVVMFMGLWGG